MAFIHRHIEYFHRNKPESDYLKTLIKNPSGKIIGRTSEEIVLNDQESGNLFNKIVGFAVKHTEVGKLPYNVELRCPYPDRYITIPPGQKTRMSISKAVSRWLTEDVKVKTNTKEYNKLMEEIALTFKSAETDYEIKWDSNSFDILGHINPVDNDRSCYHEGGVWDSAPASLDMGFFKNVPTFVIFLKDNNEITGRCWGFEYKPDIYYISNFYYRPGLTENKQSFVRALEKGLGLSENSLKANQEPAGFQHMIPLYVNRDGMLLSAKDFSVSPLSHSNIQCPCGCGDIVFSGLISVELSDIPEWLKEIKESSCVVCTRRERQFNNGYQNVFCQQCAVGFRCNNCNTWMPKAFYRTVTPEGAYKNYCEDCTTVCMACTKQMRLACTNCNKRQKNCTCGNFTARVTCLDCSNRTANALL